jgi:ketosteroid isomerase-like protein
MTVVSSLDDFQALDPFFRIIERGVAGLVDGEHFFDLLAEDVVFEFVITVPGYPRRVEGRHAVAELYRPYGATIVLDRCYDLAVHHDQVTGVVVLEYASQAGSSRPEPPTTTATSRCCPSSSARSPTGATTSIRSLSLPRSAGPPRPRATADRVGLAASVTRAPER